MRRYFIAEHFKVIESLSEDYDNKFRHTSLSDQLRQKVTQKVTGFLKQDVRLVHHYLFFSAVANRNFFVYFALVFFHKETMIHYKDPEEPRL
jgi:hypothetical protein